jgi:RNA polymerase sigma-70 factor (ECF subfamily)
LFSEGYHSSSGDMLIREDLCEEAMRLNYLLLKHPAINLPKVNALMALMCLQASRFAARIGSSGDVVLLEDQDRSKWSQPLIQQGLGFLEKASASLTLNEYLIEASIASVHSLARRFEDTSWSKLAALYEVLLELKPNSIVRLNRAIAIGYSISPERGIEELEKIENLHENSLYQVALGNFYFKLQDYRYASDCFTKAIANTVHPTEREFIEQKKAASEVAQLPDRTYLPSAF